MRCPVCDGRRCDACGGRGEIEIKQCPQTLVTADVWEAIEFAELYEKGLPPVAGGALDQAQVFIEACRMIWAEQAYWKKRYKIDG